MGGKSGRGGRRRGRTAALRAADHQRRRRRRTGWAASSGRGRNPDPKPQDPPGPAAAPRRHPGCCPAGCTAADRTSRTCQRACEASRASPSPSCRCAWRHPHAPDSLNQAALRLRPAGQKTTEPVAPRARDEDSEHLGYVGRWGAQERSHSPSEGLLGEGSNPMTSSRAHNLYRHRSDREGSLPRGSAGRRSTAARREPSPPFRPRPTMPSTN